MNKNKFLLTLELRYNNSPKDEESEYAQFISDIITIGIYDTKEYANLHGNFVLEILESKFSLNEFWKRKERFNNKEYLISDLGYLKTPFSFFLKITELKFSDLEERINRAVKATERYKNFKIK